VVAVGALVLATVAVAFALNPAAWERITMDDTRGSGRVDIWTVAWSIFRDNPVTGVGVNNFGRVAPEYVRDVGPLENVQLVVKTPDRKVHNSFLELLSENGIPALVMFLAIAVACMRASLRAAKEFTARGQRELTALSHGLFLATTGLLASYFFMSPAVDRRLWILFGLSLAALEIAQRNAFVRPRAG
jgi:O-antigen ligase